MLRPRWRKVLRDLWSNKTRTLLVVLSIAVGVFAIGMVGGSRVIQAGTKKIMIARNASTGADDDFITLSAVCTHAGCTVKFSMAASQMQCPCHGSKFMLDGTVAVGPAVNSLKVFPGSFDMPGNLLTIMIV